MADAGGSSAAVASSSTAIEVTEEQLADANRKFEAARLCLKDNNLEEAVQLFGEVLQTQIAKYGDLDLRCADTYYRYGSALFYKAQEEADVFGASLQQAVKDKGAAEAAAAEEEEEGEEDDEEAEEEGPADAEKENVDEKGKGPARMDDGDAAAEDEPGESGEPDGADGDMQLAWEMLEVAKLIYSAQGDAYRPQLADVQMLLADIAMEQESFESAAADYATALGLLAAALGPDDRRLAEAHYKHALALQFLDEPEKALQSAKAAIQVCETRIANLKAADDAAQPPDAAAHPGALPAEAGAAQQAADEAAGPFAASPDAETAAGTSGATPAAPAAAEPSASTAPADKPRFQLTLAPMPAQQSAAQHEVADLEDVLEDLHEKVDELTDVLKQKRALQKDIKAAFSQVVGAGAPVQNLGVVGRGSKRITLQPAPGGSAATAPSTSALSGTAAPTGQASGKRSFDDLMGGSSGSTTIGFGGGSATAPSTGLSALGSLPSSSGGAFSSSAAQSGQLSMLSGSPAGAQLVLPKRAKVETLAERTSNGNAASNAAPAAPAPAKPALPAFLQPQNVAAVYKQANGDAQ